MNNAVRTTRAVRIESMRRHLNAVVSTVVNLDSLLSEAEHECNAEQYAELLDVCNVLRELSELLNRRATTLTRTRFDEFLR